MKVRIVSSIWERGKIYQPDDIADLPEDRVKALGKSVVILEEKAIESPPSDKMVKTKKTK